MNCQDARAHFIELADGRLPGEAAAEVRGHLGACAECRREFETLGATLGALDSLPTPAPSPRLRANVLAAIEDEKRALRLREGTGVQIVFRPTRRFWRLAAVQALAACALVAAGFVAGARRPADTSAQREIADLRRRVDSMGRLVGYSLLQGRQQTANSRLAAVLTSENLANPDESVIDGLLTSLALDPSVSVRLNALEALYAHADQDVVRAGVVASLPREQSPLVQVAMIDFLAAAKDRDAAPALQRMAANEDADRNVRQAATRALSQF
jgi:hypothetical protein